jgi:Putative Flp pilus-assembly TadE/G-like
MAAPCARGGAARANLLERPAEMGGATLVGLALAGFVLMAGVVAVDIGALAGARAAAQTAADMAALAALAPEVEHPPQREPARMQPPEPGPAATQTEGRDTFRAPARMDRPDEFRPAAESKRGQGRDVSPGADRGHGSGVSRSQAADQGQDGRASRAAEIAMANGAELMECDCSAVQAVVSVRRRVRFVPGGLTVLVTARARAVLGRPPP